MNQDDATAPAQLGGHAFAPTFSSRDDVAPAPPSRRRPRRRGVLGGVLAGIAVILGVSLAQVSASLGFDAAVDDYRDAAATADAARSDLETRNADLRAGAESARLILGGENEAVATTPAARDALAAAATTAETAAAESDALLAATDPPVGEKPGVFWDLFARTAALQEHRATVADRAADLTTHADDVSETSSSMTTSGLALLADARAAAAELEEQHPSARNDAVIALRDAADDAAAVTALDESAVAAYSGLQAAGAQLLSTEQAELAEKAGPLQSARLEIEAFARSLAPGVLLEFDWAPIVNGAGGDGSMGGYTTWWWDEPGRAVIELSDSVAEQWPADRSKALVAHEVGHAISVKCQNSYDSSTQDSIEKWATAWAISMGFTDDANGVWAYGYPPQNYIDAAAGCR